jgi:hypothetical protein
MTFRATKRPGRKRTCIGERHNLKFSNIFTKIRKHSILLQCRIETKRSEDKRGGERRAKENFLFGIGVTH